MLSADFPKKDVIRFSKSENEMVWHGAKFVSFGVFAKFDSAVSANVFFVNYLQFWSQNPYLYVGQ